MDECHGKESLSLCWVTPTSSLHADSADEGLRVFDQITTQKATSKVLKNGMQLFRVHRRWFISRLTENKLIHILYGNMQPNRKGSSKGKKGAERDLVTDPDEAFRLEISSSLPEAAMIWTQPGLFDADWTVPCRNAFELSSEEGVAIANKNQVPAILRVVVIPEIELPF